MTSATVDAVTGLQGILVVEDGCIEGVVAGGAREDILIHRQIDGLSHDHATGNGVGSTGGNFAFTSTCEGQVMFQHSHAVVVDGFSNRIGSPVSAHGGSLGGEIGVGIKRIGGVHTFIRAVLLIMRPRVHARLLNQLGYSGSLRGTSRFDAKILGSLGIVVFIGVEIRIGSHIFRSTKLHKMCVSGSGAVFLVNETVGCEGSSQGIGSPVARRIGFLHLRELLSHVVRGIKPFRISKGHVFILRRIIEVVLFLPSRPRVGRGTVGQIPQKLRKRACGEGQPMSRWYPCRVSCKPSQGPPMRGTCPPKRPVERLVQSYAENYSAISWKYSGKYPCLPGKAVPNREPTSVGAGHKNRSFSKTPQTAFPCLFHCDITHSSSFLPKRR